jgi:glycosyltransferase involved in cell wall biosynthesis
MLFGTKSVGSKAEKRAFFSNKINGSRGLEGSDPTGTTLPRRDFLIMKSYLSGKKNRRITVLTFVACYLPGYKSGGPVRTIANMVRHLGDEFDFWIVARDRDAFDTKSYSGVKVDDWNTVGKAQVFYASPGFMTIKNISRLIRQIPHDVLYLNSFFNFRFSILPLVARRFGLLPDKPVILASRGEFSQGALGLKARKKQIYLSSANTLGLYNNMIWQASSEHEVNDIKREMGKRIQKISIAPDLPSAVPQLPVMQQCSDTHSDCPLKIIFLSRISPMKNLDYALGVLAQVKAEIQFDLYGIVDDQEYWRQCRDLIEGLPENIRVEYKGCIVHEKVFEIFSQYDLFFLPTKGENFGHVIYESLSAGTPPLISDQTPWRDFEEKGVGWVLSLDDMGAFVRTIEQFVRIDCKSRCAMRERARQYAVEVNQNSAVLQANKDLFLTALG